MLSKTLLLGDESYSELIVLKEILPQRKPFFIFPSARFGQQQLPTLQLDFRVTIRLTLELP